MHRITKLISAAVVCTALVVALLAPHQLCDAVIGGDVSEPFPQSTWNCCRQKGWDFVVVRSWHSYNGPDVNAVPSLNAAKAAGIPYRDAYHFPCPTKSAEQQVAEDWSRIKGHVGMLWLDFETDTSPGCSWSSNLEENCKFVSQWLDACAKNGIKPGVYASLYMWSRWAGAGCTVAADRGIPLWYADYDGRPSFDGFRSFGGWTRPHVKQYQDRTNVDCPISADANWYPN